MTNPTTTRVIRTPDQRLRIFVSSTLQELAAERDAARSAIIQLNLTPVMFELGARPHPPATCTVPIWSRVTSSCASTGSDTAGLRLVKRSLAWRMSIA